MLTPSKEAKMIKKRFSILFAILAVLVPFVGFAAQATVEGTVQGFTCVTQGITCPVGKEDPMAAVERVFVVLTDTDDYYFVPNVDRAVLARHINKKIRVIGEKSTKYKSIQANQIQLMNKGNWENAWSRAAEDELVREMEKINKML
jgi:hypothetical protein